MAKKKSKSVIATVFDANGRMTADGVEIFQLAQGKGRNKKFETEEVVKVFADAKLEQGNLISVGKRFTQKTALVKSVQVKDGWKFVTLLKCAGDIQVQRVGYYCYEFLKEKAEEKIGTLPVCLSNAAMTVLREYTYWWTINEYVGEALFVMPKIDVRPLDRIVFSRYVSDKDNLQQRTVWMLKEFFYMVDEVDDKRYEGLTVVSASADNRRLPPFAHELWHKHSKNV
ncbi:MAG: hypothetical protein IJ668_04565 [Selenomonadaceae bacterium]|nr:hypothetical protein [Selenomonadaceae bacterium]